jgi:hypothetical protein
MTEKPKWNLKPLAVTGGVVREDFELACIREFSHSGLHLGVGVSREERRERIRPRSCEKIKPTCAGRIPTLLTPTCTPKRITNRSERAIRPTMARWDRGLCAAVRD